MIALRRMLLGILAVVVSAACGSSTAVEPTPAPTAAADQTPPPQTPAPPPALDGEAAAAAPAAPGAAAAPSGYPDLAPGESRKLYGEIPFEIELEPTCATVGTVMRAAIRTVPDALVGGAVRYSDGQPHGDYSWGRTPTGDWVWTWTIKPDVPTGKADAMVTGGNSESGGGAAMATFVVADRC